MDSQRTGEQGPQSPQAGQAAQAAETAQAPRDLSPQVIAIVTTEHYNLQSGRAMTISDANGRASVFLHQRYHLLQASRIQGR